MHLLRRALAWLRKTAAEMERASVSAAGPSHKTCCQVTPEEIERRRASVLAGRTKG